MFGIGGPELIVLFIFVLPGIALIFLAIHLGKKHREKYQQQRINGAFITNPQNLKDEMIEMNCIEKKQMSDIPFEINTKEAGNEGKTEIAATMAIKMLHKNEPIDKIAEYTGLTIKQIQELANKI